MTVDLDLKEVLDHRQLALGSEEESIRLNEVEDQWAPIQIDLMDLDFHLYLML